MVAGNWMNNDGLYIQYGTSKAVPTTMGDYLSYGETREVEFTVTFANAVPAGQYILGNTTMFPSGVFIEQVEMDVEVAAAGGTSFSIGTVRADRTTTGTGGTAAGTFINGEVLATITPAGKKVITLLVRRALVPVSVLRPTLRMVLHISRLRLSVRLPVVVRLRSVSSIVVLVQSLSN